MVDLDDWFNRDDSLNMYGNKDINIENDQNQKCLLFESSIYVLD